jgi:hypothetical protein
MSKHTPGPWVAHEQFSQDKKSLGWIIEHGNGRIGWSSYSTAKPNEGEVAPYPIGGANAHLIAQAPALLEGLSVMVAMVEDFLTDTTQDRDHLLTALDGARAIVARATGS